ncbi:MAG: hypothetical protein JW902_10200 [Syntrophaceae bacterium]|nr:hypothetical protein [Syntrophaceae bacterium]
MNERYFWVVEADIRNYFGTIEHEKPIKMLQRRIDDRAMIGQIRKWLKAWVLQPDCEVEYPQEGTAQGVLVI